jgi:hypothetical protein
MSCSRTAVPFPSITQANHHLEMTSKEYNGGTI